MTGNGDVIQGGDALHVANPYVLAVGTALGQLFVTDAVLAVVFVGGEGEAHAADVAALNGAQQFIGTGGLGQRALHLQTAHVERQLQRAFALTPTPKNGGVVVEGGEHHVAAVQQVGTDTTALHHLVHLAVTAARNKVHTAHTEHDSMALNRATAAFAFGLTHTEATDGDVNLSVHLLAHFQLF